MNMIERSAPSELASLASPLPPAPAGEVFTDEQWTTLLAICDVFVPSLASSDKNSQTSLLLPDVHSTVSKFQPYLPESASSDIVKDYLEESAVSLPEYKDTVRRKFRQFVPVSDANSLGFVLSALNTKAGSLLLTGWTKAFHEQDLPTRAIIVSNWAQSYLSPLRAVHRSLAGLAKQTWLYLSPTLHEILDFPDVPKHIERNPSFEFKFHDFSDLDTPTTLNTDVVIVGSGCGAGVLASHLSRAGLKCIVVEKSYHFPSTHFPMSQPAAATHLMENGGLVLSDDQSIGINAGSTWGGGGTINWSASLQPQHFVRDEWTSSHKLPLFNTREFQDCLDTVCSRMGVANPHNLSALSQIKHNFANSTLLEGSRRLGIAAEIVPQNTASKHHFCGSCSAGCSSATKQGPANCWLPDAASHGAEFIEGCFVDKILFSSSQPDLATGVAATWTSRSRTMTRQLTITASRVIVASGTLQSPLLLRRSGLANPHIGRNLHLHPVAAVWATWPHRVNPWEGAILTAAVTSLENLDGAGHGPKIEALCSTPGFANLLVPWRANLSTPSNPAGAALDYKLAVAKHAYSTSFISLQRDRDSGYVYADPQDPRMVRVSYTASARDCAGVLAGQLLAARIAYVQGAVEIDVLHPNGPGRFVRSSTATAAVNDEAFQHWLASLKGKGLTTPETITLGSAHQMGTCRMSASADRGVVDSEGKVWGCKNVYVGDASVFPSASGVNPMVTNMGIAEWIARGLVREWSKAHVDADKRA